MISRLVGFFKNLPPAATEESTPAVVEDDAVLTVRALDELRSEVRHAGGRLPPVLYSQLRQIDDLLITVVDAAAAQNASTEQRVLLDAMVRDYIPTPLHAFLALPDADQAEGSPATGLFATQLGILEETIRDLLNQVRSGAIAELSTHGRFLADKFEAPPLRLDGP